MNSVLAPVNPVPSAKQLHVCLQCPVCRTDIDDSASQSACSACGFTIAQVDGIYRALAPDREQYFRRFIREYELVRRNEGRGSATADYYLALPFQDLTGCNSWQWEIRACSFQHIVNRIFLRIEPEHPIGADVLDMGAGNGWLSYRLAARGHRPVALDLGDNTFDGLGAAENYFSQLKKRFPCFQSEMDRLPFASSQFDCVIFNAAFHYSTDYERTLRECLRCLRRPGYVVIADSPFYSCTESGDQMIREKHAEFQRKFGFLSNSIQSREFITRQILSELSQTFSFRWNVETPWYGVNWALRPIKARLRRKREPAKFHVAWARVEP
jgi:ubiquinone/menaquinone biosynthesis C-methylase UbiE